MDNLDQKQADDYCRTCLDEFSLQIDESIRKKHAIFPTLAQKLDKCTNTIVSESDEFSNFLCDGCYTELMKFHLFQAMCIASLERFREVMNKCAAKESKTPLISGGDQFSNNAVKSTQRPKQLLKNAQKSTQIQNKNIHPKSEISTMEIYHKNEEISNGNRIQQSGKNDKLNETNSVNSKPSEQNLSTTKKSKNISQKTGKIYVCETCPMRFFVEHRLMAHKRAHEGLIPYPCSWESCNRGFKRWHCLNEHIKQHEGTNKWFSCKEEGCERRYKHRTALEMHMRRFHKKGPELKSFVCEICGKVFKSSAVLNDHRFTHKDKSELPFACDQPDCKHRFSNREKLKVHLMRHAGIKNFECPHCGMKKTTRNELKIHINYHTLERTFPCRFCTQVCNSAGNLKVHVRTVHERAKDYACRFCERTFAKPDTRKYHEMIHTGEKPHECIECGKKFVQPAALRTHKKIHMRQKTKCTSELEFITTIDVADIQL